MSVSAEAVRDETDTAVTEAEVDWMNSYISTNPSRHASFVVKSRHRRRCAE